LNVSSANHELEPYQAKPLTSQFTQFQRITGWSLIYPFCFIAIITHSFTG
jgi:hypothetical protein